MAGSLRKRPELGADAWESASFLDATVVVASGTRVDLSRIKRAAEKELGALLVTQDFEPNPPENPKCVLGEMRPRSMTQSRVGSRTDGTT